MFRLSTRLLKNIQHHVFPPACPICHRIDQHFTPSLSNPTQQHGCCAQCLQNIKIMSSSACLSCGIPLPITLAPGPCGTCLQKTLPQQSTKSLYIYHGAVRDALLAWKLQGQKDGLYWLLQSAAPSLQQLFSPKDLLIPVPMPIQRMRRSGLHHSADLCQAISRITSSRVDWSLLRRTGNHTRQSALKGKSRQQNLRKAFTLNNDYQNKLEAYNLKGRIWVVDDILTTGATLRHACQTMKRSHYPIFAFSFARTLQDS